MTFRLEFNSDLPALPPILSKETIFKIPEYPLIYSVLVIRQKTMMCPSISWSTTYLKILWERKVIKLWEKNYGIHGNAHDYRRSLHADLYTV